MTTPKRQFLIDTDTASDDAVALLMALRRPDIEVLAITVVAGNVPAPQGAQNALYTAELCGSSVPVYIGAHEPLLQRLTTAQSFHGQDGMGDQNYPPPARMPEPQHAVDMLIETIRGQPGLELVTLGPLTNIALALRQAPDIAQKVARCVVMGGSISYGNVTPAAEYNIWCDPEAARVVFHSGLPVEMVGWELCAGHAAINEGEMAHLRAIDTPFSHFALDCNTTALESYQRQNGQRALALADPVAMAVAIDPSLCLRSSRHLVEVETSSPLTRGMTIIDRLNLAKRSENAAPWADALARQAYIDICWELDVPGWKKLLFSLLA